MNEEATIRGKMQNGNLNDQILNNRKCQKMKLG